MTPAPIIILVRPQMAENIGMTARAMLNCGLTELRLVAPRDTWIPAPDTPAQQEQDAAEYRIKERLHAAASGADSILDAARIFPDLRAAITDLHYAYATTARDHDMVKAWKTPRAAMPELRARVADGQKIGLIFGPERTGLTHEDMTCANEVICIPSNPEFSSLNLAQAVLVLGYEWFQAADSPAPPPGRTLSRPATKEELHHFFDRLESALDLAGFFTTPELRPAMIRNLRNALQRAAMTEQEIRTWHGVITALQKLSP